MTVSNYVIEYKAKTVGDSETMEYSTAEMNSKLEEYKSAGKLITFHNESNDVVRVWADQATLDEYNTWFESNGKAEWQATNTSNGHTITKTVFKAI